MMTELQFLERFQPSRMVRGRVQSPSRSTVLSGPVMIDQGTSFCPGALFMGLDLAKELDQMAAKHHFPLLYRLRSRAVSPARRFGACLTSCRERSTSRCAVYSSSVDTSATHRHFRGDASGVCPTEPFCRDAVSPSLRRPSPRAHPRALLSIVRKALRAVPRTP